MIWTLDRPAQANGIDAATMAAMEAALTRLEVPGSLFSCLMICGQKNVFSTGLDAEMLEVCFQDRAAFTAAVRRMGLVLDRLAALPQVVIACVDGECRLGGLELALACDLIVAGQSAAITDGHLGFDAMPGGGATKRLPARLGYGRALQFLLESPDLDAQAACAMGLVDVVADGLASERGAQIARIVTDRDPGLMRDLKASLRAVSPPPADQSFLDAFQRSVINRLIPE
ncbi:enoyl-CoA hydratase/isomerase family protein [Ruegeria sp. 2012CJ41-6]|uniref:Enoyl-CoA hydratase/isomerase family protein n=1 Tax=Ruegeria spongiae TaxID=2942209 RepID=A0ABT0PZQ9_9RHOB|nr:enoyl-CoA hydratase/isomerase family protein [Ruegeria spongiae]MCL6283065.1 enoyl-CoA hydratase/isomerase family protein [Ruegeria spongiae]